MSARQRRITVPETPFRGSLELPEFRAEHADQDGRLLVRYSSIGNPSLPAVVVLGGVSADADIVTRLDGKPGWWNEQVGPGRPLDTTRVRVIGMDFITGRNVHGAICRHITTRDQANVLAGLLNTLRVRRLQALVGASYGAMVGLAFAARYPERLQQLVAISGAHRAHPRAVAIRAVQRRIIASGAAAGKATESVALARALAMISYREHEIFELLDGEPRHDGNGYRFPVEDYLEHNGRKHAARFDADEYHQLSESLDLHEVDPALVTVPVTLIAVDPDFLVPLTQMQELLERLHGRARLHVLRSAWGHDAFLKETARIGVLLREAVAQEVLA